ncbi:hypothetical protein Scep_016272 [Stephania cephalantha]|uniref:Uncharacterized protein n=1 Tax=Stephania cephalantha TaxID=152367 RepID=A0AAP0NU17_9MAGN
MEAESGVRPWRPNRPGGYGRGVSPCHRVHRGWGGEHPQPKPQRKKKKKIHNRDVS